MVGPNAHLRNDVSRTDAIIDEKAIDFPESLDRRTRRLRNLASSCFRASDVNGQKLSPKNAPDLAQVFLGHPIYWLFQAFFWLGLWTLFWIAFAADSVARIQNVFLLNQTVLCFFGLLSSHLVRVLYCLRSWNELRLRSLAPRVLVLCAILACAGSFVAYRIVCLFMRFPFDIERIPAGPLLMATSQAGLALVAWSAIYLGYQYQRQLQESQLERLKLNSVIKEAQLQTLRHQVNPHFLFNSLNTIRALVDENRDEAREAITKLSELFRASLQTAEEKVIPLREELRTVEAYLALQKLRFEERLVVAMQIDELSLDTLVPPFLVQTLVENALKHGDHSSDNKRMVKCEIQTTETTVRIQVKNSGVLGSSINGSGMGLANAEERLKILYGSEGRLRVYPSEPGTVTAEIELPR
jgi:two-component system LytT family sensor kinase